MQKKPKYPRINFKIGFCSSQDGDCPASELLLQSPECKGWQSARYCSYPQVILLQLSDCSIVRQITVLAHHSKIPSRVEVDYQTDKDSEFTRLGHFSMGNNQQSDFKMRELKNIPVSFRCAAVRFTLHKNHVNKHNLFNQVGLISICLYGEQGQVQNIVQQRPEIRGPERMDRVEKSSMKLIQELQEQKKQAVENEDYEKAGKIKLKIDEIKKYSAQLDDLEQRKKLAVQREDYDTARTIHEEIKKIRDRFEKQDFKAPASQPYRQNYYKQTMYSRNQQPPKVEEYVQDEEPAPKRPAVQTKSSQPFQRQQERPIQPKKPLNVDDIPINVKKQNPYEDAGEQPEQPVDANVPKKLQNLKGEQLKLCQPHFAVVDEQIFMKIFSKHHILREQGIEDAKQIVNSPEGRDKNALSRAIFVIVKATLDDKIANVVIRSQELFYVVLQKLRPRFNDSNISAILNKFSDFQGHTNEKVKLNSWDVMKELPNFQITNKDICIQSLVQVQGKKSPKIIAGRLEALCNIVKDFSVGNNLQDCATFGVKNIQDKNNEVRNAAISLIRTLIEQVGYERVASYLKNVRPAILKLFEDEREEMPSNRQEVPIVRKTQYKKTEEDTYSQKTSKSRFKSEQAPLDQCPYCQKRDPQFANQDYRDIHLYNTCAMLMLCECQQAIQVSSLSAHLTSQCKNSKYYKKCPRCKEAVHQSKYKSHVQAKDCNPAKPLAVANRCPLCHEDISAGVGGWKQHLVDVGCPNHSR